MEKSKSLKTISLVFGEMWDAISSEEQLFRRYKQMWMVNFRVRNLDRMVAQLKSAGITVDVDPQQYPSGRFARLHDPDGNPIELSQPGGSGCNTIKFASGSYR